MGEYKTRAVNTAFLTHVAGVTEIHEGALWCLCLHALAAERERETSFKKRESPHWKLKGWRWNQSRLPSEKLVCFLLCTEFIFCYHPFTTFKPQPPTKKKQKTKTKNKKQAYLYPECLRCLPSVQFFFFTNIRMHEFEKKPDRELMTLWWTGFPASLPVCCISVYENIRGAQQQSPGLESLLCLVCTFLCRISSLLPHTCMSGQWWL